MSNRERLADVCEITMGLSPAGDTYNHAGVGLPLLNGPTEFGPTHPTSSIFTTDPKRTCSPGALLFCVRGSTGRMNWADQEYAVGRGIAAISASTPEETRFVRYALEKEMAVLLSRTSGSTMPMLKKGDLENFEIYWPQNLLSVSSILNAFDNLIDNNLRRIKILEETARLLYREWFVNFRYPGHEDVPLVDSELGSIPEGWQIKSMGELITTQYGYTQSATEDPVGPKYLRGMDINKSSFIDWSRVPYCPVSDEERKKFAVSVGDIFIIRMADPGKVGICESEEEAVFASYLVRVRPIDSDLGRYFLFYFLNDDYYQGWITGASSGTTRKSISAKLMLEPLLALPPPLLLKRFERSIIPLRGLITKLVKQNSVLDEVRDLLLPRLVSGELDVSDLELTG